MRDLSSAYAGSWRAAFRGGSVRFNDRLWRLAGEHHSPEDTFLGLHDRSDGSSFVLRVEEMENTEDIRNEDLEAALFETIAGPALASKLLERLSLEVGGVDFEAVKYAFINPKHGDQHLVHAFSKLAIDAAVILLAFAWPAQLPTGPAGVPVKLGVLLGGVSFERGD